MTSGGRGPDEPDAQTLAEGRRALVARCLPFGLFIGFLFLMSFLPEPRPAPAGEIDWRWIYAVRTVVVGAALLFLWRHYDELRKAPRLTASDWIASLVCGVVIFGLWIVMDTGWMVLGSGEGGGFDPRQHGSEALHWPLTVLRLIGLAIVIPLAEELFWRSFLMRWLERPEFLTVEPAKVGLRAFVITAALFAVEHSQWLAGLLAGVAYGWLYMRTGKLWAPVIAHAVTNGMLGVYILATGQWRFW
jgi:CAAX prenyl protease-like protein